MVETGKTMGTNPIGSSLQVWEPKIDGPEINRLRGKYLESDRLNEEGWHGVVETAAVILGKCPDPNENHARRVTGLALGKVQSGKTLSYTALIALAIDNGYRITVVLAGTKNALLLQNYTRLCQDLDTGRREIESFKNLNLQDARAIQGVLYNQGHALAVILKHTKRIDALRRVLTTPEIRSFPTLIIDDEGDEASLNTRLRSGKHSATYNSILNLRKALKIQAFVAYTATPQANLLVSGIDDLSPDFGVMIEPGKGYCGGSTFFGCKREQFVRLVPVTEAQDEPQTGILDGVKSALATFLVGCAIRHIRDSFASHSMLIHNSNLRDAHKNFAVSVQLLVEQWQARLRIRCSDHAAQELIDVFREAYDDLCITVESSPSWNEVHEQLRNEIMSTEVWMVNSLPTGRDPIATPFRLPNNVLVGGNMLGRGVTIDGLAVTYITRRAKNETNADTMEQRARWFGYKQPYLDLCRIYTTEQLRDNYTELLRHEDDLWEALRRNERQGLSIRDWPRMLSLDTTMGLRPTRSNVANFRQFRGRGWDVQYRVIEDVTVAESNVQVIRSFFDRNPSSARRFGNVEHLVVENCQTQIIIRELLNAVDTEGTDWEGVYTTEFLSRLLFSGNLQSMEVLFMSKGETRKRTKRKGRVNPMQGRTPYKSPSGPAFYRGDLDIHNNRVQLQVHIIQVIAKEIVHPVETTAFALYIPQDDPRFNLEYVVRDGA